MTNRHALRRIIRAVRMEMLYQEYLRISMLADTQDNRELYVELQLSRSFY